MPRSAATTISFSVDGIAVPVESWEGGDPRGRTNADNQPVGAERFNAGKQLTGVVVAPLTLEFSVPLPAAIQNWISDFFANQLTPHNLVLTESTISQTVGTGVALNNCVLTEVRFSSLDAGALRSMRVAVVIQAGNWQKLTTAGPAPAQINRSIRPATSFRLQIAGLGTEMVGKIEAFTVRRPAGGGVEFPNILVTMAAGRAADWIAWRDTSLGLGTAGAITPQKKDASLQFLDSAQSPGPFGLRLEGLQIIRTTRIADAGSELNKVLAEMLCDRITVASGAATAPATTTAPAAQPPAEPTTPDDKPATPAASATSSADQGERDPADFPRPEGMERQTFVASSSQTQQREYATYSAKAGYDDMLARYDRLVEKAGWKPAYRTASGDSPEKRMIIIEWHRAGSESVAEVRIYSAKSGSTVSVTVTTYKPAAGK